MSGPAVKSVLLWSILLITLLPVSSVRANLQVFPTRLVLSDSQKAGQLSLRLAGDKPQRFQISTVFYRMKPDASLELVATPTDDERPAKSLIRFSPRSVELQPNVEQIVRVIRFSSKQLEEGEYRAHLLFEPVSDSPADIDPRKPKTDSLAMQLEARIAIAIPIIVRHGDPQVTGALSGLRVLPASKAGGRPAFEAQLVKSGNGFLFGDLELSFIRNGESTPRSLATILGVSSYIPNRVLRYQFDLPEGLSLDQGRLRLEYRKPPESGGTRIAEVESKAR